VLWVSVATVREASLSVGSLLGGNGFFEKPVFSVFFVFVVNVRGK
jgi:hypothetical protein